MLLQVFIILLILASILAACIWGEKIAHPNYNPAECTRKFKTDFSGIVSVLFSSNYKRHIFDASLCENIQKVLKEYCHDAFEPSFSADFYDGTPRIHIAFVPCREFASDELSRLVKLLRLKLNQYLQIYGLCWRTFGEYHVLDDTVTVYIYYSEHKEDLQPFLKRYRIAVKHKTTASQGVLHDEELDREINYVEPKH